jgi:hypothetical protein
MRAPKLLHFVILGLLLAAPVLGGHPAQRKRNRPPKVQSFMSSKSVVDLCPFSPSGACSSSGTIVTLAVKAKDPDNDHLTYKYSVSAGTISGSGAAANWDLIGVDLGTHTAKVEVVDQLGGKASSIARVNVAMCGACDPPCPTLSVTCPKKITEGEVAVFVATVTGGDRAQKLTYLWSHSNGKLILGQDGAELRIEAIGLPDDVITATVRILGVDPACNSQASCESKVAKRFP